MKKSKRVACLVLAVVILVLSPIQSYTSWMGDMGDEYYYRDIIRAVEEKSGIRPETPIPHFDIISKDSKELLAEARDDGEEVYDRTLRGWDEAKRIPWEHNKKIKVGDKVEGISKPELHGKGKKVEAYDWQVMYWHDDGSPAKFEKYKTKDITVEAKKPGYIIFFLNVADDQVFYNKETGKRIPYQNWASEGNWRAHSFEYIENKKGIYDWWFIATKIRVEPETEGPNLYVKDLEIIDKETGDVVDSFKREVDNINPFDLSKQEIIRTTTDNEDAPKVQKGSKYTIRSTYKFISFDEGEFDILKPEEMTEEQRNLTTEINKNELNTFYSYDDLIREKDKYNETGKIVSNNKPMLQLRNLEEATFEWDYEVPYDVEEFINLSVRIPEEYKDINTIEEDDWATVKLQIAKNDLAMIEPVKLLHNNRPVEYLQGDDYHSVEFTINHLEGEKLIGDGSEENPYASINVIISDGKKVISKEKIKLDRPIRPKETLTFRPTKKFKTSTGYIKACATIDEEHAKWGQNIINENDKICKEFKSDINDMAMVQPVNLLHDGKSVSGVRLNERHGVEFNIRHESGSMTIGDGSSRNPYASINVTISDGGGHSIKETISLNHPLKPGETGTFRPTKPFISKTGKIIACATIDRKHAGLNQNIANSNDTICKEFSGIKNYKMISATPTPSRVFVHKGTIPNEPVGVELRIGHKESNADESLVHKPVVVIKRGGTVVWEGNVDLLNNAATTLMVDLGSLKLNRGANKFSAEVNPASGGKRPEVELVPGEDPYSDNKVYFTISVEDNVDCVGCDEYNTNNKWNETYRWVERTRCKRDPITRACRCNIRRWSKSIDYNEKFIIDDVKFRSKLTWDKKMGDKGWIDVGKSGQMGGIKSGYGMELKVTTLYDTNRYIEPKPDPYGGPGCTDSLSRSPSVYPVDNRERVFVSIPGVGECFILQETDRSGPWHHAKKTFEFASRGKLGRKVYVKPHTNPGIYGGTITTSIVKGYEPTPGSGSTGKELLQDCGSFKVRVLPQDDMKTHIIQ